MATLNALRHETTMGETTLYELGNHDAMMLPNARGVIRVLSGTAWITSQSKDYIVFVGEELTLPEQDYYPIIGSLKGDPLTFEYRRA